MKNEQWKNKFGGFIYAYLALSAAMQGNKLDMEAALKELNTKFAEEAQSPDVIFFVKQKEFNFIYLDFRNSKIK